MDIINHLQAYKAELEDTHYGKADYRLESIASNLAGHIDALIEEIVEFNNPF